MLTASVENMLVTSIDTTLETGVVPMQYIIIISTVRRQSEVGIQRWTNVGPIVNFCLGYFSHLDSHYSEKSRLLIIQIELEFKILLFLSTFPFKNLKILISIKYSNYKVRNLVYSTLQSENICILFAMLAY